MRGSKVSVVFHHIVVALYREEEYHGIHFFGGCAVTAIVHGHRTAPLVIRVGEDVLNTVPGVGRGGGVRVPGVTIKLPAELVGKGISIWIHRRAVDLALDGLIIEG